MTSDFENKCLVCLKTGSNLNIFTTYHISDEKEELFVEVIKNCFNIEITQDTGLNALCSDCSMTLKKAYNFKNRIVEAFHRLVSLRVVGTSIDEKDDCQEYLENRFENNYDINTVLNPETGQISYTLDQIDENQYTVQNEQDTYLIDLENDTIINKKDVDTKKVRKYKRKIDVAIVKENIPGNVENKDVKKKPRVRKDRKKKEAVESIEENAPNVVYTINNVKEPRKSRSKKDVAIEGMENKEGSSIGGDGPIKKKSNANEPPPFTLEPGQSACKMCGAEFNTTKALSTHMNIHYPVCVCAECGMVFASERRLRMHKNQAHVEGPLNCKYCDKKFTNVNTRNAHMWRVHTKTDPYKCSQCDERFKTYLKRLRHVQNVHGNAVEYPCQYCDKKFAYAAYRTKHIRTKHLEIRTHKCPSCPYSFARRRELDAHRASKHGHGEMKYQCDICSRKFFLKTALTFHLNLHSNRYACTQCDAKFSRMSQLETHYKEHANNEPEHDIQAIENLVPILEPESLQLDELTDFALMDCTYWGLSEM